jgi:hypothetical protein
MTNNDKPPIFGTSFVIDPVAHAGGGHDFHQPNPGWTALKASDQNPWCSVVTGRPGEGMSLFANEFFRRTFEAEGVMIVIDAERANRSMVRELSASQAPQFTTRASKGASDD